MKTHKHRKSCKHKHRTSYKHRFSKTVRKCKRSNSMRKRSNRKRSNRKRSNRKRSNRKRSNRKRSNRNKNRKLFFRGGGAQYPAVYGIDNKAVLYPISPHGITAGFFDPPIPSNGPDGNGPIGCDVVSGKSMSGKGTYLGSGGGSQMTLAPQSLVNLTRSLTGGVTEVLNGFGGYTNSDSLKPMPYNQPGIDQNIKVVRGSYPDLGKSYEKADKYVSNL